MTSMRFQPAWGEEKFAMVQPGKANMSESVYGYGNDVESNLKTDLENHGSFFDDSDEMEYAAELLEISSDEDLRRMLARLIRKEGLRAGRRVPTAVARALGVILKGIMKKSLPILRNVQDGRLGGRRRRETGRLSAEAGHLYGLELEGLSPEDQEFELARHAVRFASAAAKRASRTHPADSEKTVAVHAALSAAKSHAPGLLKNITALNPAEDTTSGRWYRHGRSVVIVDG